MVSQMKFKHYKLKNMKKLLFLFVLLSLSINAQNKYLTKTGIVDFEASMPAFEAVSAKNNAVTAILNTENGEFAALVLVKGFRFKNALMEEHFNENYAESDKFPKASFKGTLQEFNIELLENTKTFGLNGILTFHSESKIIKAVPIEVTKKENRILLTGTFNVKASEFNIKIPKVVRNKIAEDILVSFSFELDKK